MGLALRRRAVLGRAVLARPIELAAGLHGRFQPQPVLRKRALTRLARARRRRLLRHPASPAAAGSPLSRRRRRRQRQAEGRQRQAEGRPSCCGEAGEGGEVRVHGIEGRARPKLYLQQ